MTEHRLFYYPYASFTNAQFPLLKVAALYFDKLVILDPDKATGGTVGSGDIAKDVALLEGEGILSRIAPEEVLEAYEQDIATAVRADLDDPTFLKLCEKSGKVEFWTLALAKVPKEIRDDPQHQEYARRKLQDRAMQRFMGELPLTVASEVYRYEEGYMEVYDEGRQSLGREIEYRYADYPLPVGEAIMMNHALFAGLLHSDATPITDDPFHNRVLSSKLHRMVQHPFLRDVIADRARTRHVKAATLAATALTDPQLKLPVLSPEVSLDEVLEYRNKHDAALQAARDKLGWMARRIEAEPWTEDFAKELEHQTIPDIATQLSEARKARDAWLKNRRGRLSLQAAGVAAGAATAVLAIFAEPMTPIALAAAGSSLASSAVIPGVEWLFDWRDGKKTTQENGLHYLLQFSK